MSVPRVMEGCIDLSREGLIQLKSLLDKALSRMEKKRCSLKQYNSGKKGFYTQPFVFGGEEGIRRRDMKN